VNGGRIQQKGRILRWTGADRAFIRHYFALDVELDRILDEIDRDPVIAAAIERYHGLRILRQPAWECLASYICATNSNITRIRHQIAALARQFGEERGDAGNEYFTFPEASSLATAEDCSLALCRLGYRAPYLCDTARRIADDPSWEERISSLPYIQARRDLMTLKGVGRKVADCVLLFAFGRYEAVPVDVWIRRIMERHYPGPYHPGRYDEIARYARGYFGRYAGYAQEYLYCARDEVAGKTRRDEG
jgi:N-glycosylase/DNA lyase